VKLADFLAMISLVTLNLHTFCLPALFAAVLALAGCNKVDPNSPEVAAQRQEEQRLKDQQERAVLAEKMKAAALAREQKQEPIKALQKKIDALDQQISDARSRGKDWRPLAKAQEALEAEKYELERK
jgi:hypothetical protein